ncbi:MAG TPA: hypothetical protein VKB75_09000 [Jatrophihabitans sp.]|nr:hypothetical protein [Jatrophihabitans sp.]
MPGRHQAVPGRRPRLRWLVGMAAGAIAGATLLTVSASGAPSTVNAQLSLSGVATRDNVLGGSEIGVHPGDTVVFKASALPTAGLENVPGLGSLVQSLLSGVLGNQFQVVVSFGSSFPGGAQTVTLGGPTSGSCKGLPSKTFTFPDRGTYGFTWKVQYVAPGVPLLGPCTQNGLHDAQLNQLASAGVAMNASNRWVGKIVVADNPPKGGISIQLPGVSVAPSIAGHQLPTVGVPGLTLPTVTVPVPSLPAGGGAGGGGGSGGGGGGGSASSSGGNNPVPIPAQVVPGVNGGGLLGEGGAGGGVLPGSGSQGGNSGTQVTTGATASPSPRASAAADQASGKPKTIDLAASRPSSTGEVWVVLAIVAVIALAFVAATYARLYLMRGAKK